MPFHQAIRTVAVVAVATTLAIAHSSAVAKKKSAIRQVRIEEPLDNITYGQREDVMRFGADLALRHGLDSAWVQAALAESRLTANVIKYILPPPAGTAKNWAAYRARFVEPKRVNAGVAFWAANEAWLRLAEDRYGVPPEIIVGIVGVETLYGQHMGTFRVIDALATLAFDFPASRRDRSAFFRDELEEFFVLCHQQGLDPLTVKGSYAGAIGLPQFMPSSINRHAVDYDGDGHREQARTRRIAKRRRRAELRRRHDEFLRGHALQLVELLRDGGDRVGGGGEAAALRGQATEPMRRQDLPVWSSRSSIRAVMRPARARDRTPWLRPKWRERASHEYRSHRPHG